MRQSTKLEWVVVLRGVAALWVFAYHIWLALGGLAVRFGLPFDFSFGLRSIFRAGYQGVDLFFVLSGFVIAWPYVADRQTRLDRYQLADFYQRRYLRIAPVYYLTLAVAVALMSAGLLRGAVDPWSIAAHLLFAQNFIPEWVAAVRGVYWTLPTEIHFYIVFPLLLRFLSVDRPLRLALCLIAGAIGYRWFLVWLATRHGFWLTWTAAYLPGRIDQFGCGMAAACLVATARAGAASVRKSTVVLAGLLALACLVLVARNASTQLDFWYVFGASIAGAAIALFIGSLGVYAKTQPRASPGWARERLTQWLYLFGDASLSIYLWHTFFIDLALVASSRWGLGATAKITLLFGTIPVALGTSILTYRAVEAPMIAFSKSAAWRSRVRLCVGRASAILRNAAPRSSKSRGVD
jgi:peptidoglycan/LPS O-acetylase OafA/YrhL